MQCKWCFPVVRIFLSKPYATHSSHRLAQPKNELCVPKASCWEKYYTTYNFSIKIIKERKHFYYNTDRISIVTQNSNITPSYRTILDIK